MTLAVASKLLALLLAVAAGWVLGRRRLLGEGDLARPLGQLALYLFVPALLLRTTTRVDLSHLPWRSVAALFVPVVAVMLLHYLWQHRRGDLPVAGPGTRALTGSFGNTVQVGIPLASALFGEAGLALHVTLVSLHALILLTVVTSATELALARSDGSGSLRAALGATVRNTVIHPVVLPVMLGITLNLLGLPLPAPLDDTLALLASGVVPLCLVLIGLSLAAAGWPARVAPLLGLAAVKLVLQPTVVLVAAHWVFGLSGMPLTVVVMLAALPSGSNAQIFAQRYRTLEVETAAAILLSTLLFLPAAALWLALLGQFR